MLSSYSPEAVEEPEPGSLKKVFRSDFPGLRKAVPYSIQICYGPGYLEDAAIGPG